MPQKETFTSRFEETREGRVPQKYKVWEDIFCGWSLMQVCNVPEIAKPISSIHHNFKAIPHC